MANGTHTPRTYTNRNSISKQVAYINYFLENYQKNSFPANKKMWNIKRHGFEVGKIEEINAI